MSDITRITEEIKNIPPLKMCNELREVIVAIYPTGKVTPKEFKRGYFHCWGMDWLEVNEGSCPIWSVGIVELEDGTVIKAIPNDIKFCSHLNWSEVKS